MSDKFTSPCALPTAYEREVLTILIEEAAEVQQRATKLLRFGANEVQPGQPLSNSQRLSMELGDLAVMIEMAHELGLVSKDEMAARSARKREKLARYMQEFAP